MTSDLWFECLMDDLLGTGVLDYFIPVAFRADISFLPFGPYDAGDGTWKFRSAIDFESASPFPLLSMTTGSIFFYPAADGNSPRIVLARGDSLGEVLRRAVGILPKDYPAPQYVIYDNVDPVEAEQSVKLLFESPEIAEAAIKNIQKINPLFQVTADIAAQLTALWMTQRVPSGLFVLSGTKIGASATSASGKYLAAVRMVDEVAPISSISYNPCHHLAAWAELNWLKNMPTFNGITDVSGPPSGNGTITPIKGGAGIGDAIANATPGDTILITDTATYAEAVIIDKALNLMGSGIKSVDDPAPDYPTLTGQDTWRPLTFSNVNSGLAYAGRLIIEHGFATGPRQDGGGVLVEKSNGVVIASAVIRKCAASGDGVFGEGFGGGIAVYHSSPAILECWVTDNQANSRGKGIGIYGYGWPTIFNCLLARNSPHTYGTNPRHDGGGIAIQIAVTTSESIAGLLSELNLGTPLSGTFDPEQLSQAKERYVRLVGTIFADNISDDDGGAVYITCASRVILRDCKLLNNKAASNGGGLRATFAAACILRDCTLDGNTSNYALKRLGEPGPDGKDVPGVMGGGLSARNADLINIARTNITNNTAFGWAGGGLAFISTDEGNLLPWWGPLVTGNQKFDWNDFLWDAKIYDHEEASLRIDGESRIEENQATVLPTIVTSHLAAPAAAGATSLILTEIAGLAGVEIVINEGAAGNEEKVTITQVPSSTAPWHAVIDPALKFAHAAGEPVGRVVENHGKGGGVYLLRWAGDRASGFTVPEDHRNSEGKMEAWPLDIMILDTTAVLPAAPDPNQNHASFPGTDRLYYQSLVSKMEFKDQDLADREASQEKVYINDF